MGYNHEQAVFRHRPKSQRLGLVNIEPSQIANLLQLPEDAVIRGVVADQVVGRISVVIEHPSLNEVPEGCSPPALSQQAYSVQEVDADTGQWFTHWHLTPVIPGHEPPTQPPWSTEVQEFSAEQREAFDTLRPFFERLGAHRPDLTVQELFNKRVEFDL